MTPNELINEIDKLAISQKLLLVETIWDSIAQNPSQLPLPEWQKDELDKRYAEFQKNQQTLHECSDVHQELKKNFS